MSLFRGLLRGSSSTQQRAAYGNGSIPLNSQQTGTLSGTVRVGHTSALRASGMWAALRLRRDLVSSMTVRTYRDRDGQREEIPNPPVVFRNGGRQIGWREWLSITQFDLDRSGNTLGIITKVNGLGLPAEISMVGLDDWSVRWWPGEPLTFRVMGATYTADQVWHERQHELSGFPLGLDMIAYAAWSVGGYLSAQDFALEWFGNSAMPAAYLKNTQKQLSPREALDAKIKYKSSVASGDVLVTGNDWDLKPIMAAAQQQQFVESMQYGIPDIARFTGVPADAIDGAISGSSLTYGNLTQYNQRLLTMHMGPAIDRRNDALTRLSPSPRYTELDRASTLLAMDPETQARVDLLRIKARTRTNPELRKRDNLPPLTPAEIEQFDEIYGAADVDAGPDTDQQAEPVTEGAPA